MNSDEQTFWTGRFLEVRRRGTWEYVTRPNSRAVVGVLAVTSNDELILVEQFRPPVACNVIEVPAGLVGDEPDCASEAPLLAAQRELREETGYVSSHWSELMSGPSSAGLTDEVVVLFLAEDAVSESAGGGVASENITVHRVRLEEFDAFCRSQLQRGAMLDFKIFAGLQLLHLRRGLTPP